MRVTRPRRQQMQPKAVAKCIGSIFVLVSSVMIIRRCELKSSGVRIALQPPVRRKRGSTLFISPDSKTPLDDVDLLAMAKANPAENTVELRRTLPHYIDRDYDFSSELNELKEQLNTLSEINEGNLKGTLVQWSLNEDAFIVLQQSAVGYRVRVYSKAHRGNLINSLQSSL